MYVASDPRSRLAGAAAPKVAPATDFGPAQIGRHYQEPPQVIKPTYRAWYTRGESFLSAYIEAKPGAVLERKKQPDEFMLLLPDPELELEITWKGTTTKVKGYAVVFVPPGESKIEVKAGGRIIGYYTTKSTDLVKLCGNSKNYEPDPNVGKVKPWPEPKGGFKVRRYSLDIPKKEGRLGRIFRCTTLMVNYPYGYDGPRDITKMSPHHHDDFQQCSLILEGTYVHHLRWPWLSDKTKWRPDVSESTGTPSVTFIPARVIHTSEAVEQVHNQLIDIFCPPRVDFSKQEGWVLNANDYPAPKDI